MQVVFGLLLPKFFNDVCPLTSFGFFNLCTGITLRCCAVTKDGGWEHPGHCCNAIKSGLRTELGLITRKEAKLIENVVHTTL